MAAASYNQRAMTETICERIAAGESLRAICSDVGMPSKKQFLKWMSEDASLSDHYAIARARQADHYADEIVEISDTEEDPQKARVRIDARKWVASKLQPKRYGDKIDHNHEGNVIMHVTTGIDGPAES